MTSEERDILETLAERLYDLRVRAARMKLKYIVQQADECLMDLAKLRVAIPSMKGIES